MIDLIALKKEPLPGRIKTFDTPKLWLSSVSKDDLVSIRELCTQLLSVANDDKENSYIRRQALSIMFQARNLQEQPNVKLDEFILKSLLELIDSLIGDKEKLFVAKKALEHLPTFANDKNEVRLAGKIKAIAEKEIKGSSQMGILSTCYCSIGLIYLAIGIRSEKLIGRTFLNLAADYFKKTSNAEATRVDAIVFYHYTFFLLILNDNGIDQETKITLIKKQENKVKELIVEYNQYNLSKGFVTSSFFDKVCSTAEVDLKRKIKALGESIISEKDK